MSGVIVGNIAPDGRRSASPPLGEDNRLLKENRCPEPDYECPEPGDECSEPGDELPAYGVLASMVFDLRASIKFLEDQIALLSASINSNSNALAKLEIKESIEECRSVATKKLAEDELDIENWRSVVTKKLDALLASATELERRACQGCRPEGAKKIERDIELAWAEDLAFRRGYYKGFGSRLAGK